MSTNARAATGASRRSARAAGAAAAAALLAIGAVAALSWAAGSRLSAAVPRYVGDAPADLGARSVAIDGAAGRIAGWYAAGTPGGGAVLLLHGLRSDRRQMLERARWLRRDGYAVLLVDLPAHGESAGERIGFGLHEADGVRAALGWLQRELPRERIGAIGVSLGAAALVYAAPAGLHAAVLESAYATIDDAARNRLRLRLGAGAQALAPLLLWQLPLRLGVTAQALQPLARIGELRTPVLVAGGDADRHATPQETARLHAAARAPKSLWLVPGAGHVDLHAHDAAAYRARIAPFLAAHLRGKDAAASTTIGLRQDRPRGSP